MSSPHFKQNTPLPLPEHVSFIPIEAEDILRSLPDMELRSYLGKLLIETKRVTNELARRQSENGALYTITHPAVIQSKPVTIAAKSEKQIARESVKQAKVQAALDILFAAMQSGKMTKDQISNTLRKGDK